jgi:hypothetical protein
MWSTAVAKSAWASETNSGYPLHQGPIQRQCDVLVLKIKHYPHWSVVASVIQDLR